MVGAFLRKLVDGVDDRVHEALVAAGFEDVRLAHHVVFQYLHGEGSRVTELAERARMTKQSMQYLVDHLEEGGYLERVSDLRDGRAKMVRLTARGRSVERAAREAIARLENEWADEVGRERFAEFFTVLEQLAQGAEDASGPGWAIKSAKRLG